MTTRDPRSHDPYRPDLPGAVREPTQSLSLLPEHLAEDVDQHAAETSHPSLALGTHGADAAAARDERTSIASPGARAKTPLPAAGRGRPPPIPARQATADPDRVGTVLGSYKILELLGKGGMGYVFRAEHTKLGREVALKLLRSDYARRRDAVARFFQEARTVNRVRHRNIVDVTDFVELDDGTTFIIMELLCGQSLGKWARTGIDLPRALAVLVQICDGLAAAHDVGVIHRDLKPDNVIVVPTPDGAELVKLLDFGVAKLVNRDDEDVGFQTAAGSVIGTPAYMSPEQAGGMPVDARSDIYSLGAIMYELFCGQPLFRGRSFGEYVRKHLTEPPVPPRATPNGAQIDPRLEALILRCLEKDPIQRFPKIAELRDALFGMLGGVELQLPALAALSGSGVRAMASVTLQPMPQLPQAPSAPQLPAAAGLPGPGRSGSSPGFSGAGLSGSGLSASGAHPSQIYGSHGYGQLVPSTGIRPPRTPWWAWLGGAALAIGLGVGSAIWYAGRGDLPPAPAAETAPAPAPAVAADPAPEPAPAPAPEPVAEPITGAAADRIEIKLDSLPSGSVHADGHSAELCRTPCTFEIDPRDGGPLERRTYVVRSDGYRDGTLVVDLTGTTRSFQVTLEREAPDHDDPTAPGVAGAEPARPVRKPPATLRPVRRPPPRTVVRTEPAKAEPAKAEPARPDSNLLDPSDGRTPRKKPPGPIDPTDTLDPFKPK